MDQSKISVIIPVYNVEKYLNECIESVTNQTYENLEILLVNDGSTDRSGEICEQWAAKDSRIVVIHKKNGGLSDARNAGIQSATGEMFSFIDSDDVISSIYFEKLYRAMMENGADISACQFERAQSFSRDNWPEEKTDTIQCYDAKSALNAVLNRADLYVTACNKLYRRDVIKNIAFELGKYHEDEFWSFQIIGNAERIVSSNQRLYGYRQRTGSITNQKYCYKHLDLLDARAARLEYFQKHYAEFVKEAKCDLRFECIRALQFGMQYFNAEEYRAGKKRIMDIANSYSFTYSDYKELPTGRKVWCALSNLSIPMTARLRNFLHYDHKWGEQ